MLKQDILDECARRVGDEDATFKSNQLSKAFDFVLLELAQEDCLSLTRKVASFTFSDTSCSIVSNLLQIDTPILIENALSMPAGTVPERIESLLVPGWGVNVGTLCKVSDMEFEGRWMAGGDNPGRPSAWRIYPDLRTVQVWPAPNDDSIAATCHMTVQLSPASLADGDTIAEVLPSDMPTILAGLYTYGILYRDETFNDQAKAQALWQQGKVTMRERKLRVQHYGRRNQIVYRDF